MSIRVLINQVTHLGDDDLDHVVRVATQERERRLTDRAREAGVRVIRFNVRDMDFKVKCPYGILSIFEDADDGSCMNLGETSVSGYLFEDMDDMERHDGLLMDLSDLMGLSSQGEFLMGVVSLMGKYEDVLKELTVKSITEE